jgi:hypothetical protein
MARVFRGGVGVKFNNKTIYNLHASWAIATVDSIQRMRVTTGLSDFSILGAMKSTEASLDLTYRWQTMTFRLTGTLTGGQSRIHFWNPGQSGGVAIPFDLQWTYASAGTFTIEIFDDDSGDFHSLSGVFNVGQDYAFRIQTDGAICKVWVDGVLLANFHTTGELVEPNMDIRGAGLSASQFHYFHGMACWESDDEADRPGSSPDFYGLQPNADSRSACYKNADIPPVDGDYLDWNDFTDEATFVVGLTADGQCEETSKLDAPGAVANVANAGVTWFGRVKSQDSAKTVVIQAWLEDEEAPPNSDSVTLDNIATTSFNPRVQYFDTHPDGGPWTQAKCDALVAGVGHPSGNGAHVDWSMIAVEICSVADDPPVALSSVALGSANPIAA